jgi:hypothetical protein
VRSGPPRGKGIGSSKGRFQLGSGPSALVGQLPARIKVQPDGYTFKIVVTAIVGGFVGALWLGFKTMLGK